ncbi:unnamed protein product [Orchesella dallaii]|uniref:Metalloendopeptidase n=1 Tax=Orchesella dallaii TaxID=48710 RepID=A0ABP1PQI8_9HEXA
MDGELWRIWQILLVVSLINTFTQSIPQVEAASDPLEHLHSAVFDDSQDVPGEPMTPIDFQNAQGIVANSPPQFDENGRFMDPIELAGLFEGDIILQQRKNDSDDSRNGIIYEKQKWPAGQVPYVVSSEFTSKQRGIIAKAMMEYQRRTCITFKPRTTENDYIHIHRGSGCSSLVGRAGGAQPVSIGRGCEYTGIVVHELMHAVGFWHEQSRWDRDEFVTVYFNNIQSGMDYNFRKYSWKEIQNLSVPYDLTSVMHYGSYAFSKGQGKPTILPKDPNKTIGQRSGFSTVDVEKVNRLYKCGSPGARPTTTTPSPTTESSTKCQDNHRHCAYWSKRGECTRNPAWMKANCRSSCGQCNKPCENLNKYCGSWAKRGECSKNSEYMTVYCQKSCSTCPVSTNNPDSGSSTCQDKERHCDYWAKNGECTNNPQYMHKNCPKACRIC